MDQTTYAAQDESIDLIVLWHICRRYWVLLALGTLIGGAGAATYAFTATRMWRAEAIITASRESSMGGGGGGALSGQLGGLASLAGVTLGGGSSAAHDAQAILNSRRLAELFVQRYSLIDKLMEHSKAPRTLWRAVSLFKKDVLNVDEDRRAGLTTVSMYWRNPAEAATWANDYVAEANEIIRNRAAADARRNVDYLQEQLKHTTSVEVQHAMYNLVESETKTMMLADGRAEYAFSTIDPAVPPETAASPKKAIIIAVGVVVGLFAGFLAALARYKISRRSGISRGPMPAG